MAVVFRFWARALRAEPAAIRKHLLLLNMGDTPGHFTGSDFPVEGQNGLMRRGMNTANCTRDSVKEYVRNMNVTAGVRAGYQKAVFPSRQKYDRHMVDIEADVKILKDWLIKFT